MGIHGNQGSKDRCSEREEQIFVNTASNLYRKLASHFIFSLLRNSVSSFHPVYFLSVLPLHLTLQLTFLSPNQINSIGDTLLLSPESASSGVFHPADLLCACKGAITGASELMRAVDERQERKKECRCGS